jgi:hypothetical protein
MAKKSAKKGGAKKPAAWKPPKVSASATPRKKSELYTLLGESAGISRKQVSQVFETLGAVIAADVAKPSKDKPKVFTIPGMMKVTARFKPAAPARKGIDPFTKMEKMFKAKPASTSLKIRPLRALKAMV